MDRVSNSSKHTDLFGSGKHGFKDGTIAAPDDLNGYQEELVGIIEAAGLTPSGADLSQVLKALLEIFPYQYFPWRLDAAEHGYDLTLGVTPSAMYISPDGTRLYVSTGGGKTIYQYDLLSRRRVATASGAAVDSYVFGAPVTNGISDFIIAPDGSSLIVLDGTDQELYQYTFGTPWDISTLSYASKSYTVDAAGAPNGVHWAQAQKLLVLYPDGTVTALAATANYDIGSLSLSETKSYSAELGGATPYGISMSTDGTILYIGANDETVYELTLTAPFVLANYTNTFELDTSSFVSSGGWLHFDSSGRVLVLIDTSGPKLVEYLTSVVKAA